jgi:DNA-binding NtrC family response regulator
LSQPRPQASSILKPDVSQKKRILVVDDEVDITIVFKLGLEKADFVVDAYTDPVLALSEYKPDMMIYYCLILKCQKWMDLNYMKKLKI